MTDMNPTTHGSHASESYSSDRASSGTVSNGSVSTAGASRRLSTETKHSFKTTELPIFVLAVLGVLIASALVDDTDFGAQEAWKYVTWLTIGYLVSRGLAKSGSRDFYDDDAGRHGGR
jgi:hypothetical protein